MKTFTIALISTFPSPLRDYGVEMTESYGLEAEDSQGQIAINLLPLISKAERAHLNSSIVSQTMDSDR